MISNLAINAHNFIFCQVYQGPNEYVVYHNDDNSGHFHSWLYLIEGSMDIVESDTEIPTEESKVFNSEVGVLYDVSHSRKKYIISKTQSQGASFVTFNPVPSDRKLNVQILEGKQTLEIHAIDTRITIACITGPITVNGKTIKSSQYAVAFNKTATLSMEENTICAIVKDSI